jgi:hypothetical protein
VALLTTIRFCGRLEFQGALVLSGLVTLFFPASTHPRTIPARLTEIKLDGRSIDLRLESFAATAWAKNLSHAGQRNAVLPGMQALFFQKVWNYCGKLGRGAGKKGGITDLVRGKLRGHHGYFVRP